METNVEGAGSVGAELRNHGEWERSQEALPSSLPPGSAAGGFVLLLAAGTADLAILARALGRCVRSRRAVASCALDSTGGDISRTGFIRGAVGCVAALCRLFGSLAAAAAITCCIDSVAAPCAARCTAVVSCPGALLLRLGWCWLSCLTGVGRAQPVA